MCTREWNSRAEGAKYLKIAGSDFHQIQINIWKIQFLKLQFLTMLASRNFVKWSILTSDTIPENFKSIHQIFTSKINYVTEQFVECCCASLWNTERPIKCDLGHVTLPNLLDDVYTLTKFQVCLMSRTDIVILQWPDRSADFQGSSKVWSMLTDMERYSILRQGIYQIFR